MRSVFVVFVVAILFVSQAWAQTFFNSLPDFPLMPGLIELEERSLSFDKPEGRILIAVASVDAFVDDSQLESFYSQSLPQFGWAEVAPFSYVRGNEKLGMEILLDGEQRLLEVTISP